MKQKSLIINILSSIIAFIINTAINFLLSPYIVENVGIEAYGFVSLANNFISYASLLTIALNSMASRYITISLHKKDVNRANEYFSSIFLANIIISIFLCILSIICVLNIDKFISIPSEILLDIKLLFTFLLANFILTVIGTVFGIATFATNKLYLSSLRTIEGNLIKVLLILVLFIAFKASVFYLGVATFMMTLYVTVSNIYYTKKLLPEINISKRFYRNKLIIEVIKSGIWNVFTKLSSILSSGLDLLITNVFISSIAMGTLSVSKIIPNLILSAFGMLSGVFSPQLTISYAKGDINDMKIQIISSIRLLGMLSSIPMSILFVYGEIFYHLWMPTENAQLLQMLSIIGGFGMILSLPLEGIWSVFTVTNKIKQSSIYLFLNGLASIIIVFILLNYTNSMNHRLFIISGVSTVFSIIRACTFIPIYGAKCIGLEWHVFYPQIIKNTISFFVITLVSLIIKNNIIIDNWYSLCTASIITIIIGLIINSVFVLNNREKRMILNLMKNKLQINGG